MFGGLSPLTMQPSITQHLLGSDSTNRSQGRDSLGGFSMRSLRTTAWFLTGLLAPPHDWQPCEPRISSVTTVSSASTKRERDSLPRSLWTVCVALLLAPYPW